MYFLETLYLALYVMNKDFYGSIFTSAGGNFLKLLTQHIACLCYKWCQFSQDQSITKDTNVVKNIPWVPLEDFFLNFHALHLTCMGFTWCKCGFDWSLVKGTLLGEQSTSSSSYRLYCRDFPETHTTHYMHMHYKLCKWGVMCGACCVMVWCVVEWSGVVWHLLGSVNIWVFVCGV